VYAALFPGVVRAPLGERNTLLCVLASPPCCTPMTEPDAQCAAMIGQLRAAYGRHLGDPSWTHFIRRLEALSPPFAAAWAAHEVAQPTSVTKVFRHASLGHITTISTGFAVQAIPGARMVIYTPVDERSKASVARLAAGDQLTARFPCWSRHQEERAELPRAGG
jgi:hypothetical protein